MRIRLPKTRRYRICIYILSTALILFAIDLILVRIGRHITIAPDTTRITSPLRPDGTPDYIQATDNLSSAGVTAENNAAPLLLAAVGPAGIPSEAGANFYKRLHMSPFPATGNYFVIFGKYLKNKDRNAKIDYDKTWDQVAAAGHHPWQSKDNPELAAWLAALDHPLALVHDAARRPRYFIPLIPSPAHPEELAHAELVSLGSLRGLDQGLCARSLLRAGQHDFDGANSDLLAVHRLARLVAQGPTLIEYLVAIAIDKDALAAERGLAGDDSVPPAMARQLLASLDALPPFPSCAEKVDTNQRYILLDQLVAAAKQGPGATLTRIKTDHPELILLGGFALDYVPANFNAALRQANRLVDAQVAAFAAPTFADRRAKRDAAENAMDEFRTQYQYSILHPAERMVALDCSDIGNVQGLADERTMYHDLSRLALALSAYHADHHAYPDALAALASAYLPAVPVDLFVDKPLHYEVTPTGYVLYALGKNMSDDHGHNREYKDAADPRADDLTVVVGGFPVARAGS